MKELKINVVLRNLNVVRFLDLWETAAGRKSFLADFPLITREGCPGSIFSPSLTAERS